MNRPVTTTVTLPSGGTVTPSVELGNGSTAEVGATLVGILIPSALDTPTDLTIEVSTDNVTFSTSMGDGSNNLAGVFSNAVPGRAIYLPPQIMRPWRYMRIRSSLTQTANRVFTLVQSAT